jgi:hypothetical protein
MKELKLTQGYIALVDDEDYELISQYKWHTFKSRNGLYGARNSSKKLGTQRKILLHRMLLNAPIGLEVDHINGNGLDNRRENLRFASRAENQYNRVGKQKISAYKGVSLHNKTGLWRMRIEKAGERYASYFKTEEEAARAYDAKAKELFGKYARLNFPVEEN